MPEYTPLETLPAPSKIIRTKSLDEKLRAQVIVDTCAAWIKYAPQEAIDFMQETKMLKAQQRKSSGGFTKGGDKAGLHIAYRIPQPLLDLVRLSFRWVEEHYEVEVECFGLDDKDMKLLVKTFPDLFKYCHNKLWGKNKYRCQPQSPQS